MIKYSFLLELAAIGGKALKRTVASTPGVQMGKILRVKLPPSVAVPKKPVIKPNVLPKTRTAVPVGKPYSPNAVPQYPLVPAAKPTPVTPAAKPLTPAVPAASTQAKPAAALPPPKKRVPASADTIDAEYKMADPVAWNKKNAANSTAVPNPAADGKKLAPGITEKTTRRPPPNKPQPITPMTPEAKAAQAQRQQAVKDRMGTGEILKKQREEEIRLARQKKAEALRAKKARGETMKKIGSTAWSGTKKTLGYTAAGVGGAGILAYNSLQPNSK